MLKGGASPNYKTQLLFLIFVLICIHSILAVLVWTNQIQFVATDAKQALGILFTIAVALLFVYFSYLILQSEY
jgi:succinate dehydrogenase hydrophobic anchor subunit